MNPNPTLFAPTAGLALQTAAALAGPANDDFANRLAFARASVSDTTVAATKETGEPNHALGQGQTASGKFVWDAATRLRDGSGR